MSVASVGSSGGDTLRARQLEKWREGVHGRHTAFLGEEDGAVGGDTTGFKEGGQTS